MMKAKKVDVALIRKNVAIVRKWNATIGADAPTPNVSSRMKPERAGEIAATRDLWTEFVAGTPLAGVPYDRAYRAGIQAGVWPRRRAFYERKRNGVRTLAVVDSPAQLPVALAVAGLDASPAPALAQPSLPLVPPIPPPAPRPSAPDTSAMIATVRAIVDLPISAGQKVAMLRSLVSTPAA
jgi:hypothetical protein